MRLPRADPSLLTHVHNISVISPAIALPADISIRGRIRAEQGGKERESFFKDTPLTPRFLLLLEFAFLRG